MNKRDVIIISILINAGLLSVLFFTASRENSMPVPIAREEKIPSPPSIVVPENKENEELIASKKEEPVAYVLPSIVEKEKKKESHTIEKKKEEKKKPLSLPPVFTATEEIKVKPGDTLEKIAKRYKVSVKQIMSQNHLSDSFLHVGQSLKIPVQKTSKEESSIYYVVKAGDNPWTIAMKHHIKVDELLQLNHLNEKSARRLKPGDKLRIR